MFHPPVVYFVFFHRAVSHVGTDFCRVLRTQKAFPRGQGEGVVATQCSDNDMVMTALFNSRKRTAATDPSLLVISFFIFSKNTQNTAVIFDVVVVVSDDDKAVITTRATYYR